MSKNIAEIPFTEIAERTLEISRSPENAKPKIKGAINDVYVREIPYKFDWNFMFASSALIVQKPYDTGTVSVNTGGTTVTFSSDVSIDPSWKSYKLKISGNDTVYDFTYSDSTGGTISPSFWGDANASNCSYSLYKSIFSLAKDFDRFPKDGGVFKWTGGRKEILQEESYQEYAQFFEGNPSTPEKVRLVGSDTAGCQQVEFRPVSNKARIYGYDYIKRLNPLYENTQGTVTISANGTNVVGDTNCRFTEAKTGDFLRIDAFGTSNDSSWYRIINILDDSSMTLQTAFASSGVTSSPFTISAAPDMPIKLHPAILWGSLKQMTIDQNDESSVYYLTKYNEAILDAHKLYVSRVYSQKIKLASEDFNYRR